jgi:deoxyadenosine/deoxycytidine kinase
MSINNSNASMPLTTTIISIEGNIGSGKSTLLEKLRLRLENINVLFLQEPVDIWDTIRDSSGQTMLQKFYADQTKYAFSFQIMAYISRLSILKKAIRENPGAIIITERSLHTDKMVFAKMLFDSGLIEDVNYQIYLKWFDEFTVECPLNKIIYVKADPEVCFNRIKKRSRAGESNIPLNYLQDCHKYHEDMVREMDVAKLLLDGNQDIFENRPVLDEWIQQIEDFIV